MTAHDDAFQMAMALCGLGVIASALSVLAVPKMRKVAEVVAGAGYLLSGGFLLVWSARALLAAAGVGDKYRGIVARERLAFTLFLLGCGVFLAYIGSVVLRGKARMTVLGPRPR